MIRDSKGRQDLVASGLRSRRRPSGRPAPASGPARNSTPETRPRVVAAASAAVISAPCHGMVPAGGHVLPELLGIGHVLNGNEIHGCHRVPPVRGTPHSSANSHPAPRGALPRGYVTVRRLGHKCATGHHPDRHQLHRIHDFRGPHHHVQRQKLAGRSATILPVRRKRDAWPPR